MRPKFRLWLESECWVGGDHDLGRDSCNAEVTLEDGRRFGLTIWTFAFVAEARAEATRAGESRAGAYLLGPDLFVERLDRAAVEDAVADLLEAGGLPEQWRVETDSGG